MFRLQINKTQVEVLETEPMTSGSIGIYTLRCGFSDHWDGFEKTAVFYTSSGEDSFRVLLDSDDSCIIPAGVFEEPDAEVYVGVCGTKGDLKIPTVAVSIGKVLTGICNA